MKRHTQWLVMGAAVAAAALLALLQAKPKGEAASHAAPPRGALEQVLAARNKPASLGSKTLSSESDEKAPSPIPLASEPIPANIASSPLLPTEARFTRGGTLSATALATAFSSERYDRVLANLEAEAVRDPDARQQTEAYRSEIERSLAEFPGLQLGQFACGLSLCLGEVRSSDSASYQTWADRLYQTGKPKHHSFSDFEIDLGGGRFEYRIALSIDAGVNGVSGKAGPATMVPAR